MELHFDGIIKKENNQDKDTDTKVLSEILKGHLRVMEEYADEVI